MKVEKNLRESRKYLKKNIYCAFKKVKIVICKLYVNFLEILRCINKFEVEKKLFDKIYI